MYVCVYVCRFDECLVGLKVNPAVLTVSHLLKRNMDYSNAVRWKYFLILYACLCMYVCMYVCKQSRGIPVCIQYY